MKNTLHSMTVLAVAGILAVGCLLGGCQSTTTAGGSVSQKETLLVQVGFHTKTVTTPDQQKLVGQLAVDKVTAVKYKGKLYYVFPTGKKDQIYVGKQAQYNAYKQALQAKQAQLKAQQAQQTTAQGQPPPTGYQQPTNQSLFNDPVFVGETAGPRHIGVEVFDGFGPLDPMD